MCRQVIGMLLPKQLAVIQVTTKGKPPGECPYKQIRQYAPNKDMSVNLRLYGLWKSNAIVSS